MAIYAEDVVDGRAFVSAARALAAAGQAGRAAVAGPVRRGRPQRGVAHGSMTSPSQVVDAACAAGGVRRVDHPAHMADLLEGLLGSRRMPGRRVAVLTDGGGHGAVAADALTAAGLETPLLGEDDRRQRLRGVLWASSSVTNPVDLAGAGDRDPMGYARAVECLLAGRRRRRRADDRLLRRLLAPSPGRSTTLEVAAAHAIAAAAQAQHKPVVVHTIFPAGPTAAMLRAAGIPVHRDVDRASAVLAGLEEHPLPSYDAEPEAAPPVTDSSYDGGEGAVRRGRHRLPGRADGAPTATSWRTPRRATGFPLVLKALGPGAQVRRRGSRARRP